MYGKTIRDFIRVYTSRQRRVAVEIGTGRAQLLTAMRLASPNTLILTCDICPASAQWVALAVDRYASSRWLNCTFIPNYEKEAPARSQMSEQFSELLNEDSSVKVDFLSLDGDISRKGLIEDLKWWLPHLSESCTIYFSGAILCHDSVKVLVDDICADFRTYRTCRDFEYDAGSDKKKSVSSVTKRPVKQDSVRISGAPSYSSERKILKRDFFEEGFWDEKAFDVKYELVMTHPGMIFFEKSSNISWDQILEKVKSLEA